MGFSFDPINDGEPTLPLGLYANLESSVKLLQLYGALSSSDAADLRAAGVTFYGYLPDHTYLVRAADTATIEAHPAVRWLGSYHPAYKISPMASGPRFVVTFFPDAAWPAVVEAAASTGATIIEQNEAAHLVVIEASLDLLPALAASDEVLWIQNAAQMSELNDDARWVSQGNVPYTTPLYDRGLTGQGQVGAVSDSGLAVYDFSGQNNPNVPSCFFAEEAGSGSLLPPGPSHRKVVAYTTPEGAIGDQVDGSGHGSHVVGSIAGDRPPFKALSAADGQAYNARIFFQDIGIGGFPLGLINPPSDYRVLFGQAYDGNGDGLYQPDLEPRTHSNSWGSAEPIYSVEAMQTDEFMWTHPDFLIFFAAGNQGPGPNTIGQPATAKNIVTVGATENGLGSPNSMGYFSSHGPAPLGRLKPEISAPGDRITSAQSGSPCDTAEKIGTSMATPTVHGMSLLMRQYLWDGYYPSGTPDPAASHHPSAALLKGLLINSGRPLDGAHTDNATGGSWPSNGQGWGRVTADDVLYFAGDHRGLWLIDEYALDGSVGFATSGESATYSIDVGTGQPFAAEPLKIVLSWTDYPGLPSAGGALVNNLDLVVTAPDGSIIRGNDPAANDFNGQPDLPAAGPDLINPWEVVYLKNPQPGTYTITVNAGHIASSVLDSRKQGYALIATGDLLSSRGRAEIEFATYDPNPEQSARLRVSDLDLNQDAGAYETVAVSVTNPNSGQTVNRVLVETAANSGIFTGQVTLTALAPSGGRLGVAPGDVIRLTYDDAAGANGLPAVASDTARIMRPPLNFLAPPDLADPGTTDEDGNFALTWSAPPDTSGLTTYTIEEATDFALVLLDDAEGALADRWSAGQANQPWTASTDYSRSGSTSYWSGRGDIQFFIDTALTLNQEVIIPADVGSARLSFYSRYFNDANDYGHIEISVSGGPWQRLRRLYADPRLVPAGGEMRYHQFDLSAYAGQPLRIRFRYDNGIASIAPDSPGWFIDDVVISGATWQTIGQVDGSQTTFDVPFRPAGTYFYRVSARYADGSVGGASSVVDMESTAPLPPSTQLKPILTGGGWLADSDGEKINFNFHLKSDDNNSEVEGRFKLHDKAAGVLIKMDVFSSLAYECGSGPGHSVQIEGSGSFNGGDASFRACVEDNGEPGTGFDRLSLTCLTGCGYQTTGRAADDIIDGGNIQVRPPSGYPDPEGDDDDDPSTLEVKDDNDGSSSGSSTPSYSLNAYNSRQVPLVGVVVTLTHVSPLGIETHMPVVTTVTGNALVPASLLNQPGELTASVGSLHSNAVDLNLLP